MNNKNNELMNILNGMTSEELSNVSNAIMNKRIDNVESEIIQLKSDMEKSLAKNEIMDNSIKDLQDSIDIIGFGKNSRMQRQLRGIMMSRITSIFWGREIKPETVIFRPFLMQNIHTVVSSAFNVNTIKDISTKDFDKACEIAESYFPDVIYLQNAFNTYCENVKCNLYKNPNRVAAYVSYNTSNNPNDFQFGKFEYTGNSEVV